MNTKVIQRRVPTGQLVEAHTVGTVAQALGVPPTLNTSIISAEVVRFVGDADNILAQATRAVVKDDNTFGKATDLLKIIGSTIRTQDEARKAHTAPLDGFKQKITKLYLVSLERLEEAKVLLKEKSTAYALEQRRIAEAAAAVENARIQAEAAAAARAQAALGDKAGAAQILEEAAEIQAAPAKIQASGKFGATGGLRKVITGNVTNNRLFLEAVLTTNGAAFDTFINDLRFPASALNELAKCVVAGAVAPIHGFDAVESDSFVAR